MSATAGLHSPIRSCPNHGVTLAEEKNAQTVLTCAAIKVLRLSGTSCGAIGDPVFGLVRPILGALICITLQQLKVISLDHFSSSFGWNAIRMSFLWYTEFGCKAGSEITKTCQVVAKDITKGLSLGMCILAVLVQRWSHQSNFTINLQVNNCQRCLHRLPRGPVTGGELRGILGQALGGLSLDSVQPQALQDIDPRIDGTSHTRMWLLKKKVSPITIILALFAVGILARYFGIM